MKRYILLLPFCCVFSLSNAQQKKKKTVLPVMGMASEEGVKTKKKIDQFVIGKKTYIVYQCNMVPSAFIRQQPTDTLIEYHFHLKNQAHSSLQLVKLATRKGKISTEGSYKIKGDKLVATVHYYDPYHGGTLITSYVLDKYGSFTETDVKRRSIDSDTLSNRYIKAEKMNSIAPDRQ